MQPKPLFKLVCISSTLANMVEVVPRSGYLLEQTLGIDVTIAMSVRLCSSMRITFGIASEQCVCYSLVLTGRCAPHSVCRNGPGSRVPAGHLRYTGMALQQPTAVACTAFGQHRQLQRLSEHDRNAGLRQTLSVSRILCLDVTCPNASVHSSTLRLHELSATLPSK